MIRNFLFHRVNLQRDELWDPMDVRLFEKCIRFISKKYNVVLFEELAFSEEYRKGKNIATIMFDDGYKDNIEYALPVLKEHNVKASFYVVTECIDKNVPTWTHRLDGLFQTTSIEKIDLNFDYFPDELRVSSLKNREDRLSYVKKLKPFLKTLTHNQRREVLSCIVETYNNVELPELMMDWNDLAQLKCEGHYIGSHTVTHCMLGTMDNEEEIRSELFLSAKRIEEKLGHFPKTISYPVGSFNEKTKEIAKDVGYQIGLAVKQDCHIPVRESLFEVSRIELYNEPWWKTRLRITNRLEQFKSFIRYK